MWTFWGKLNPSDQGPASHPLVDHCTDVAQVFRQLASSGAFGARLFAHLPAPDPICVDRLAVVAFLHDLGKCNSGFQAKADPAARRTAGHVLEAISLLREPEIQVLWPAAFSELLGEMAGWFVGSEACLMALLLAAISHHGRPIRPQDAETDRNPVRWWQPHGAIDPMRGLEQLARTARAAFPAAFDHAPPMPMPAGAQQRFAGLVMLADWIGSDTQHFPYRDSPEQDRVRFAAERARRTLHTIGLLPSQPRVSRPFGEVFAGRRPTPLQQGLSEGALVGEDERVAIVESDTGSGKTEAALAWFFRLYAAGAVDGLYFALPTRVAARELYERVRRAVEAAFPEESRPAPVLLAAPGYVRVDGQPLLPDPEGRLWEDDATERRRERQWAAAHPKRFLAAPVAVGTVDQALLSVLKVKHALLRSVCLDRSLLVVDEVHASDPYMRQLLQALVTQHTRRGGHALLLSATLGDAAASAWLQVPPHPMEAAERLPYPAVRTAAAVQAVAGTGRSKSVDIEWIEGFDDAAVVPLLADAVRQGARVLAVCNTVARANALLRAVEADGGCPAAALFSVHGVVCPHHGRFARAHREVMDAEIGRRLGAGSPDGPLLLVGTQTLEQSLDIDADWLVTDLCPMDVLLQRIGRLHRHSRTRRPGAFATPRVLVRAPLGLDLSSALRANGDLQSPAGLGLVYPDGRVLQRTMDELRARGGIEIPRDNRALVERTTHPEALAALGPQWHRHGAQVEGAAMAMRRAAETGAIDDTLPFGELSYGAPDEVLTTRLGVDTWRLRLAQPMQHPFGVPLTEVDLPGRLAPPGAVPPEVVQAEPTADGLGFAIGARRYRYTRFGLERDDDA
jgi:CRISPR-associated endonuclease/helicase Cas3